MDGWDTCHGCDNYVNECTCGEDDETDEADEPDIMTEMYVY